MTLHDSFAAQSPDPQLQTVIKLAVLAVGGQGGGVLTGWIEAMARAQGFAVQATSVAGVAQRTGATIYYIEMAPGTEHPPVFALAPAAGDVNILIAAELMEAGRAIMRGFVTPDRTTLIASTHRALAVSEKMAPGDGIADPAQVLAAADIASDRLIAFDMDRLAVENGSVISATLFGALAASGTLPFERAAFEAAIRAGGKGVEASLRAFAAAHTAALGEAPRTPPPLPVEAEEIVVPEGLARDWARLQDRASAHTPVAAPMARAGLAKVVDFMDPAYGHEYLDHLDTIAATDPDGEVTREAAKYLANAMAYDDVIRVADRKTRAGRNARINAEMSAGEDTVLQLTDFLHPRGEEIIGILPARLGRWISDRPGWAARVDRLVNRGRRLRSDQLLPFLALYFLGGLRRYRRRTLRHAIEMAHIADWLTLAQSQSDPKVAAEVLRCRRLIKGYSDTHARGLSKFDRVLGALPLLAGRADAADWLARLREAALQDEDGTALEGAIATIRSFAMPKPENRP